jgi:hypothetical protein
MANFTMVRKLSFLVLMLLGGLPFVLAQNATASPFDLIPRIVSPVNPDSLVAIAVSSNPFDILKTHALNRPQIENKGFRVERQEKRLTAKEKESNYRRFLFVTILVMLIVLTLVVTIFRILIEKIWKAFINDNLLNQLQREQGSGLTLAYVILYLLFFLNAGIFSFLAARHFGLTLSDSSMVALFICIGAIAGFFLTKHLILQLISSIFPVGKEAGSYQFTILIFNITLGFFLVPLVLFIAYAPQDMSGYVIKGTFVLLALTYLFLSLRGLFIANRFLAWYKFHFLLYLCTVELAPLLVIIKLVTSHGGL